MSTFPCLLTSGQLAKYLGVSRRFVNRAADEQRLPSTRLHGGNRDRRFTLQAVLDFAAREQLLTPALEELAARHGLVPHRCLSILMITPTPSLIAPLLGGSLDVTVADSSILAGMLLASRKYDVVILDSALGSGVVRHSLGFLASLNSGVYVGVLAAEDDPQPLGWLDHGALSVWQHPCDFSKLRNELGQQLQEWQSGGRSAESRKPRKPPLRIAA